MFRQPEQHIVVGVTKTRLVANVLSDDEEELLAIVKGENGESRSFKGYEVCLVEQDDPESIVDMLGMVMKAGCVRAQIKMGFINDNEILKLFEENEPVAEVKAL